MPSIRKSSSSVPRPRISTRLSGRVTKEDIHAAGLRRWNGRARITTDWINVFHEPELCFSTGDVLVYLREPGQSSRGPAFRIHKEQLQNRGFDRILAKCIARAPIPGAKCMADACVGCTEHQPPFELYIPAPQHADLDTTFDHHITTRNYFAWMYDLPLAGRALGQSLIALKDRINFYRPDTTAKTAEEVVAFAESQRYLDFRECVDHALAALTLAESLEVEELWVDAFAHCVGLSNRDIYTSIEYPASSVNSRLLINSARLELELRLDRVSASIANFFENDLSGNFLGLPQSAREHFDRFRSWLHSYYIEQHGFWPPVGLSEDAIQSSIYATMYSDFRNLYHHLVDPKSSNTMQSDALTGTGGVCILQNIQAFDKRHRYEALPQRLPMLPIEPVEQLRSKSLPRRQSWNPMAKRKVGRDAKSALRTKALITASNRDWQVMDCLLVRRYSEFEAQSVRGDFEDVSMVDGRKVRWILIYAILQTLISVMQAPRQVRNTEGLTYSLCCRIPSNMPWQRSIRREVDSKPGQQPKIEPDLDLIHSNLSGELSGAQPRTPTTKSERRQSIPSRINSTRSRTSSFSQSSSIRDFITRRKSIVPEVPSIPKPAAFCEILVEGYGNGLNEVNVTTPSSPSSPQADSTDSDQTPKASLTQMKTFERVQGSQYQQHSAPVSPVDQSHSAASISSASVSRESSNASNSSSMRSQNSISTNSNSNHDVEPTTLKKPLYLTRAESKPPHEGPRVVRIADENITALPIYPQSRLPSNKDFIGHVLDEHGFAQKIHINTKAWDELLAMP